MMTSFSFQSFVRSSMGKVLYSMCPYINFRFVRQYFHILDSINNNDGRLTIEKLQFRCMMLLHLANIVHFLALSLVHTKSRWSQIIFSDYFKLAYAPEMMTIRYCGPVIGTAYLYYLLFVETSRNCCTNVMRSVLLDNDRSFLLNSSKPIRTWTMYALYFYQIFVVVFDVHVISIHTMACLEMFKLYWDDLWSWTGLLGLVSMNMFGVLTYSTIINYLFIGYVSVMFLVATSAICFVRFDEIKKILDKASRTRSYKRKLTRMLHFRALHVQTMKYVNSAGDIYGKFLFCFMVTNVPLNIAGVMAVALDMVNPFYKVFFSLYVFGQFTGIGLVHMNAAHFCRKIHRPFKQFISLNVQLGRRGALANRLKIWSSIEHYHTKNKYGISYGGSGLVTMYSFAKFALLYSELIMYNYRIFKEIH